MPTDRRAPSGQRRPDRPRLSVRLAIAALVAATVGLTGPGEPSSAAATGFPASDALYHDYGELVAEIHATEAARPDIVDVFSIGQSYKGREMWAAKISDRVAVDEAEPEVMFDALHHAREHLTLEQALYLFHLLIDGYGVDQEITGLVEEREVWIVFTVNPDGAEYDLTGAPYRAWRKNRQPTPGSRSVGTDLNRNYDYRWACCGGSSGRPSSTTYRGPRPFSAPETRALRDFVNSRVLGGRQQIRAHVTFHTNGQLVLWPFGYTTVDIPPTMTRTDHDAFVALGRGMAARNGYRAMQSSDLYITDGDQIDWMYARHRIFSFTWELYPPATASVWTDHYPPDEWIESQTRRNRAALLYVIANADCPYAASGSARNNCGPLYDDFELTRGWATNPAGTDTVRSGAWSRADPSSTSAAGPKQLGMTYSGARALVTGAPAGRAPNAFDLDGLSTIASPPVPLPAVVGALSFRYYFAHSDHSSAADWFRAYVEDVATGVRTLVHQEPGRPRDDDAAWVRVAAPMGAFAGRTVRIVFEARDGGPGNLVEAAVDDVRIGRP